MVNIVMNEEQINLERSPKSRQPRKFLLLGLIFALFILWLLNTPPGLLGKTDAVGYAVCHRISSHSFYFEDRPFSLCARCTGQYLGFLWGFWVHYFLGKKRSGFPPRAIILGMVVIFLFYLGDGLNSAFHLYPGFELWFLYEPSNTLRLFSGLGMGIVISIILYPLLGQTIWRELYLSPSLRGYQEWGILFGGGVLTGVLVLTGNQLLLYPLILLSTAGLIQLLTILYGVIWIVLLKKENSFSSWNELGWWAVAGFGTALIQVVVIDLVRYLLTGTWSGFLDY
jgi:uncharacterized membrane protein